MKIQAFVISCLLGTSLLAQDYVDLAKIYYANTPFNEFDSSTVATNVEEFGADLLLPIKFDNGNAFLTGAFLESIRTRVSPENSNLTSVQTINVKLGMSIQHSKKWSGTYLLLPKLASDFKELGAKDFQLGAVALFKYTKNENLKYKIGMYYNSELFGPFFVPIFGLYYLSPNEKFESNLSLPIAGDANYKLKDWLKVGVNYFALVRSYHLNAPYDGHDDTYLTKTTNEVFAYLQFEPHKNIVLQTKVGYSIGRNYSVYDSDDKMDWGLSAFKFGDDREALNPEFVNGAVIRFNLIYRFRLD